jgi:uncharacterized membrane protein
MKLEIFIVLLPLALVAVIFQFMPLLTRRGIFFSATVDPVFPRSAEGRSLLRSYRVQAGMWTIGAVALAAVLAPAHPQYAATLPTWLLTIGIGFTYWLKFREVHDRNGLRRPEVRETDLSAIRQNEPIHWPIVLPPFLAIAAVAAYLLANWNQIPDQFPVHWGMNGLPNRMGSRDFFSVFGPLLIGLVMNLLLLGFAWMLMRMSRQSVMRYVTVRMLEVLLYPLTFSFVTAALLPVARIPLWLTPVVMFAFVAGIVYWSYQKITAPSPAGETPEPQSDSYWKAGVFYYNPNDPAIFVSKRVGIGYTMNFANKVSWLVMGAILLVALLPAFLLGK